MFYDESWNEFSKMMEGNDCNSMSDDYGLRFLRARSRVELVVKIISTLLAFNINFYLDGN